MAPQFKSTRRAVSGSVRVRRRTAVCNHRFLTISQPFQISCVLGWALPQTAFVLWYSIVKRDTHAACHQITKLLATNHAMRTFNNSMRATLGENIGNATKHCEKYRRKLCPNFNTTEFEEYSLHVYLHVIPAEHQVTLIKANTKQAALQSKFQPPVKIRNKEIRLARSMWQDDDEM